jgi:hypothetical protein
MLKMLSQLWLSNEDQQLRLRLRRKRSYQIISSYFKTQKHTGNGFVMLTNEE